MSPSPRQASRARGRNARKAQRGAGDRLATCQRARFALPGQKAGNVESNRSDRGVWSLYGVVTCGSWVCAHCGPKLARAAAARISLALERHGDQFPDGAAAMLTITPEHKSSDATATAIDWLYRARGEFMRSKEWREVADEFGISTTIGVLDATHGGRDGSHPHFHIVVPFDRMPRVTIFESTKAEIDRVIEEQTQRLRVKHGFLTSKIERAIEDDEQVNRRIDDWLELSSSAIQRLWLALEIPFRQASQAYRARYLAELAARLAPTWRRAIEKYMTRDGRSIEHVDQFLRFGLELSPAENAAGYVLRWGLAEEVGMSTAKERNHLRLLDLVAAFRGTEESWISDAAADIYRDWVSATHGRQWVVGLGDACKRFGITDEEVREFFEELRAKREQQLADAGTPIQKVRKLHVVVRGELWGTFVRIGHAEMFGWLDTRAAALEREVGPPQRDHGSASERGLVDGELQRRRAHDVCGPPPPIEAQADLEAELKRIADRDPEAFDRLLEIELDRFLREQRRLVDAYQEREACS